MVADVPIGAFLSGGIDSTLVSGGAAAASDGHLRTFTIDFENQEFSEREFAAQVAAQINAEAVFRRVEPEAVNRLPQLIEFFDEPFADSSMLPTFAVSRVAREYATVALSGDGGDELFSGYKHHWIAHQTSKLDILPNWVASLAFRWLTWSFSSTLRLHRWGRRLALPAEVRRLTSARLPDRMPRMEILSPDIRQSGEARFWHLRSHFPNCRVCHQ